MAIDEQNQLQTLNASDIPAADPTAEDGGLSVSGGTPAPAPQGGEQDADIPAEPPAPQFFRDDKRNAIFAKAQAQREQTLTGEFSGHPNDPAAVYGTDVDASEMGEFDQEAEAQIRPQLPPKQPSAKPLSGNDPALLQATVKQIVNGREMEVTVEELLRTNQMNIAADQKLALASELLRRTQEQAQRQPPSASHQQFETQEQDLSTQQAQAQQQRQTSRLPANARELAEKIQLGDADEAIGALATLVDTLTKANQQPAIDHATSVLTVLEKQKALDVVDAFAAQHPDILQDADFADVVAKRARQQMRLDLQNAGYTPEQIEQYNSAGKLQDLHTYARVNRVRNVRSVEQLMEQAYADAYTWRHGRPPETQRQQQQPTSMQQRQQRKEQLQNQPAARRLSPGLQPQTPQTTVTQDRKSAFQQIRESRGLGRR